MRTPPLAPTGRALIALALVALLAAVPHLAGAASGVSPNPARPGERVNFNADGFTPRERVDFWATGPDGVSRPRFPSLNADGAGAVVWSWDVPADAPGGQWTMVARGVRSDRQVPIPFTVNAAPAAAPTAAPSSASPAAGGPGTLFSFSAGGFRAGEFVGAWVRGPDGRDRDLVPGEFTRFTAGPDGRVTWSWAAPADAAPGPWRSIARGEVSGTTVEVPFTISGQGPPAPEKRVEPNVGAPGTSFSVTAGGFTPGEAVGGWLITPAGARVDAAPYGFADGAGVARWSWTAPANAQAGRWQVVTRGVDSRSEVVMELTVTGSNAAPTPQPAGTGTVSPAAGPPESTFRFSAQGFRRGEEVAYWLTDAKGLPVRADQKLRPNDQGRVEWSWKAPRLAEPGPWVMTVRGQSSGVEARIPFTISPPEAPPTGSVSPTSGTTDTTFSFRVTGLNVIERIDTWVDGPNGTRLQGTFDVRADGDGIATWQWKAPAGTPPGAYTMLARGRDSDLLYRIAFTITR